MKQILQHLKTGEMEVAEVPCPSVGRGMVLIQTSRSLISAGTERMLVEFSKGNLIQKARSQPDKVKQVLDKIKTDGLLPTLETVFNRLDEPLPLGYCNAGVVIGVGPGVTAFKKGDRVVSNGAHAEIVSVPQNLCAKIPENVNDEVAAFTVLASIGLQGIRLLMPSFGERIVVFGLGLIGQMTVQLLRINGCSVLGIDADPARAELVRSFGIEAVAINNGVDPVAAALAFSNGAGVDGVLITASAKKDTIVHQAAQMSRKRGRIVLVGIVNLELQRSDFYEKELSFQVSCSYGPGRYDVNYEEKGHDYPFGFVRWTEQRNFEAVLLALKTGQLQVDKLITHRYPLANAPEAYACLGSDRQAFGVILQYPEALEVCQTMDVRVAGLQAPVRGVGRVGLALVGTGNFAKMTMAPALGKINAVRKYVCGRSNGANATHIARKYGFASATTDLRQVMEDPEVSAVFIATGHDSHAALICKALAAGKHVFVEKPLCLTTSELKEIEGLYVSHSQQLLMVGFNRRFSPHIVRMKELLTGRSEPLAMTMTVNAGMIPANHWVHDSVRGGGRIIGEGCHFIDLMVYLAGSSVRTVSAMAMNIGGQTSSDKTSIVLGFVDGSIGTINYFANGSKSYPKEQMEVFSQGRVLRLDNFRVVQGWGFKGFSKFKTWRQDKGHATQFAEFVDRVSNGGLSLIPFDEIVNVTLASFAAVTSVHENRIIDLSKEFARRVIC